MVTEVLTYLEMASPGMLRAADAVPGLAVVPADGGPPAVRAVHESIAAPHHWTRLSWPDQRWAAELADARCLNLFIRHGDDAVGAVELRTGTGGVEISVFGLLPEFVGRGWGGYALTRAVEEAWSLVDRVGARRRIWLYTSSLDHPNAVPNYLRRGFTRVGTETRARPDLS